jgi:hypothetical protein
VRARTIDAVGRREDLAQLALAVACERIVRIKALFREVDRKIPYRTARFAPFDSSNGSTRPTRRAAAPRLTRTSPKRLRPILRRSPTQGNRPSLRRAGGQRSSA